MDKDVSIDEKARKLLEEFRNAMVSNSITDPINLLGMRNAIREHYEWMLQELRKQTIADVLSEQTRT